MQADAYSKRYGVGLQQTLFGNSFMPDQELMIWTAGLTQWIEHYEYVRESSSWYESSCPNEIKDSPEQYYSWLASQKSIEKQKMNKPYGSR